MSVLFKTSECSHAKVCLYCNDSLSFNLQIVNPPINISSKCFIIFNTTIYFGFSARKRLGVQRRNEVMKMTKQSAKKELKSFENCITWLFIGGIGESSPETIIYAGSIDCFEKMKKFMIDYL